MMCCLNGGVESFQVLEIDQEDHMKGIMLRESI
jgi:hypothetical protein